MYRYRASHHFNHTHIVTKMMAYVRGDVIDLGQVGKQGPNRDAANGVRLGTQVPRPEVW